MEFKLVLTANRPTAGELVLEPEVPLSGVRFIEEVGKALRKSIDHIGRHRHTTLGALVTYEITVPQQMALESGLFTDTDTVTACLLRRQCFFWCCRTALLSVYAERSLPDQHDRRAYLPGGVGCYWLLPAANDEREPDGWVQLYSSCQR